MAWNKESKASRRARVAKQLRDKHGKWIEMGGGVKWFKDGKWHDGTASAFVGNNVEVTMKDGSKQLVNHREIEPIRAKGSLGAKPAKPTGSVQAKKSTKGAKAAIVKDNDPAKRLTSNAADLEEGDEVYLTTSNGKNGYGISDEEAAKREDEGFEVHLDDKDEPKRAHVVDTSGDKIIVEDSDGKRSEISKNDNVLQDDQEMDAALQNSEESSEKASLDLPLEGLDLSDEDKKKINEAKTKEEAIAALAETDAAEYLPLARQNKNKAFVDAYRKAIADINEKHATSEEEAPKEDEKKASGTPQAALEKTAANLAEDIADINSQKLEKEPEDVALDEATYDVKNDAGEEFLLTPKRGEEPGTWALDVKDSNGNVLETLPLEDQKPEEFAQAIKNSIEKNQSSKGSDAPSEEPVAPEDKPEADQAEKNAEVPTGTFEERINSKGVRDQVKSILDDAFENNNSEIQSVDLGDGKALEIRKGGRKGKDGKFEVEGVEISIRDADKVGNTSKTTDRLGTRSFNKKLSNKSSDDVLDEIAAEAKTGEENGQIFGDNSPQRKEWLKKSQKERIAADDAKRKSEQESNKAPLDKALKDAGFSDEDIAKIKDAKDETEADEQFFQSPSGKKASDKQIADKKSSPEYAEAQKAFKDFKAEKFPTDSDEKVKQNQEDQARREQEDSPEARAERAKETIESGKKRDADRAAKNTPDAKLAEIDRKIAAGEKMIDDAKAKDNEPLAKRIQENVDNLKKQREKLAPKEEAKEEEAPASEESSTPGVGEPFDSPENGVAPLSDKSLSKTSAGSMKVGDKFFGQRVAEGKFAGKLKPIMGNDVRVTPDGESWEIKDIKKDGAKGSVWEVENSKGQRESITVSPSPAYDEVARRGNVVTDTAENREKMGLTPKTEKSEEDAPVEESKPTDEAPASEETSEQKTPSRDEIVEAFDKLEADAGKIDAKTVDETISKAKPQPLGNGMSIALGRTQHGGALGYKITDEDETELAFIPFSASDDNRVGAVQRAIEAKARKARVEKEIEESRKKTEEDSTSKVDDTPKPPVTAKDVEGALLGLEYSMGRSKAISTKKLVAENYAAGFGLNRDGSIKFDLDENGKTVWTVRDKDGNTLGQVRIVDDNNQAISRDELSQTIADVANGKTSEESKTESEPIDDEIVEEEQKLVEDAEGEIEQEIASEKSSEPIPDVKATVEEALQDIEDDLGEFSWEDLKERTWPVVGMEEDLFIGIGKQSTEDDQFLALYNKDDEELETYDMKGLINDIDERERDRSGRDDSDGGSLDRGTGDDGGADSSGDENGSRDRVSDPEEYDRQAQSLVRAVQKELADNGDNVQLDDEYSVEFETDETGKERYRLYDSNDRTLVKIARKNEDRLGEILRGYSDADRQLREAFAHEAGSEERRVTPTIQMQKMAGIGTYFENGKGDRFTKINGYAWGMSKAGDNSDNKNMGVIEGHGRWGTSGEFTLGHDADHHRPLSEIEAMSDDELRQQIAEFSDRIHGIIEVDGKIGDKRNSGRGEAAQRDADNMQRFRYEAYRLNDEASDYANTLWNRLRESGAHTDGAVDIGEFKPSADREPHTVKTGTIDGAAWTALRNEYVGLDHRTLKNNFELRTSEKPSRGAVAWGNKMDKWAGSSELANDYVMYRSVLATPDHATQFSAGNVVVDKGIMSLADNLDTAETYLNARSKRVAGKIPIMIEVQGRKGEKMTAADFGSDELVVPRGAKLFVASSKMDENGVLQVTARLNPSDEEIAAWTNKSTSPEMEVPKEAPETPESTPEAMEPETISGESPSDTPETISGETPSLQAGSIVDHPKHGRGTIARMEGNGKYARVNFDKYDDPKKTFGVALSKLQPTGESKTLDGPADTKAIVFPGESTAAVGAWNIGERVNHGKHGVGTIQRLEGNGEFARVHFDKDGDNPKRTYGVKLTKLGKGENGTPSSFKDPSTKVGDQKPKQKVNSGTTETRNVQTNDKGEKFILGKNDAELYVGATIIHPKFGRGKVIKLENNGKYARVVFDNDPTNTPRGIVGARLEDASIEKEVDRTGFVEKPTKK